MQRIIFTVVNDLTYDQRMHRICTSLSEAGYHVTLVGRKLRESAPLGAAAYRQHRLRPFFRNGKMFYTEFNIRLFCYLLFKKFDAVCGIDLDTILPCIIAGKMKGTKVIYDAHELFPEVPEVINRPFTQHVWRRVEQFAVKRIRNCYTVSEGLAAYFSSKYGSHFEVIRNVPLLAKESTAAAAAGDTKFIFYQGALNEGRGLEQLITAMEFIPLQLKIAGDGDLSEQLRELVNNKRLQDKVQFLGKVQPGDLRNITHKSFIGVNLLENKGLSYYYSLANKFFDYVHAGIPVITMNFPEYRNLNAQHEVAVLVNDLDTATLVSAITGLAENKDAYFRLRQNCLTARNAWNWQKEVQKLLAFYQSLS